MENTLYFGDNLEIMRRYLPDESVDLVYADPPFKSDQNYNVLFKERDGGRAASQIRAFEDTWSWDAEDEAVFADLVTAGGKVADAVQAFRQLIGPCDMLSYLVMMAPRLMECRRVLKSTGSMYLHCDPAASHYLKLLLEMAFRSFAMFPGPRFLVPGESFGVHVRRLHFQSTGAPLARCPLVCVFSCLSDGRRETRHCRGNARALRKHCCPHPKPARAGAPRRAQGRRWLRLPAVWPNGHWPLSWRARGRLRIAWPVSVVQPAGGRVRHRAVRSLSW